MSLIPCLRVTHSRSVISHQSCTCTLSQSRSLSRVISLFLTCSSDTGLGHTAGTTDTERRAWAQPLAQTQTQTEAGKKPQTTCTQTCTQTERSTRTRTRAWARARSLTPTPSRALRTETTRERHLRLGSAAHAQRLQDFRGAVEAAGRCSSFHAHLDHLDAELVVEVAHP